MKERRKRRSAKDIKESIINAATHLIETEGFSNLTVTGIMRQAEIEPVQFYNRYDDLNKFIDEYVKKYDYWFSDIVKSQKQSSNDKALYMNILVGLFQSLSENKIMQELLKWELANNNETSQRTAQLRELHTLPLCQKFWLSGNFWLVSFKISYLCLPLFYETRTTPSCHPSGCAYRQL